MGNAPEGGNEIGERRSKSGEVFRGGRVLRGPQKRGYWLKSFPGERKSRRVRGRKRGAGSWNGKDVGPSGPRRPAAGPGRSPEPAARVCVPRAARFRKGSDMI